MASNIDDISINYEENGVLLRKEIEKEILTRGSWTTIMFLFQEYDKSKQDYNDPKVTIRRYQKRGGDYKEQSKFTISSKKQAQQGKIVRAFKKFFDTGQQRLFEKPVEFCGQVAFSKRHMSICLSQNGIKNSR